MNRQQKRASARSASKRGSAEGMAAVAMAARVAALSPEGRAAAYETATHGRRRARAVEHLVREHGDAARRVRVAVWADVVREGGR